MNDIIDKVCAIQALGSLIQSIESIDNDLIELEEDVNILYLNTIKKKNYKISFNCSGIERLKESMVNLGL